MQRLFAGFLLTVAAGTPALATDVINQDSKAYTITIVEGSTRALQQLSEAHPDLILGASSSLWTCKTRCM